MYPENKKWFQQHTPRAQLVSKLAGRNIYSGSGATSVKFR